MGRIVIDVQGCGGGAKTTGMGVSNREREENGVKAENTENASQWSLTGYTNHTWVWAPCPAETVNTNEFKSIGGFPAYALLGLTDLLLRCYGFQFCLSGFYTCVNVCLRVCMCFLWFFFFLVLPPFVLSYFDSYLFRCLLYSNGREKERV